MDADFVTDRLMVGGKTAPLDRAALKAAGITAILNVAAELDYPTPAGIRYAKVAMIDSGGTSGLEHFKAFGYREGRKPR